MDSDANFKAWNHLVSDYILCSKFHHRKSVLVCTSEAIVPNPGFEAMPSCNPKIHSMDFGTIIDSVATFMFDGDWGSVSVFCSCNGLLYIAKLTYFDWCDGIWNPMTNEFIQLPGIVEDLYVYGFGFSPKTKQYKLDGVIYWITKVWIPEVTEEKKKHMYLLHALDVETETFETSYPSDIGPCTNIDFGIQLKSFNGKLRVIITMFQPIWKTCVWIMGAKSWSREFVIDIPIHKPSKLFFIEASENGDIFTHQ